VLQRKADEKALLVPIRIELDTDTHRIRDSFTWNTHENFVTPDIFSRIFCLDLDIPFEPYGLQIAHLIKQQLDEHSGVAEVSLLAPEQEAAGQEADLRVILNLDVQMGTLHLIDRVEWDLTSPLTPEAFAAQMCADLGLGGEAVMLVAHAVHEELLRLKKDCIELGLVGGAGDGTSKGPKKLESIWRDWNEAKAFVPHLEILSPEDIDALEFEKEKNARRLFSRRNYATTSSTVTARDRGGRRR
jgi:chromatin structure-remodeling complex subunit SFH1